MALRGEGITSLKGVVRPGAAVIPALPSGGYAGPRGLESKNPPPRHPCVGVFGGGFPLIYYCYLLHQSATAFCASVSTVSRISCGRGFPYRAAFRRLFLLSRSTAGVMSTNR